jgi:phenylacetic acid degradation protein
MSMAHILSVNGIIPVVDVSAFVCPTATLIGDVFVGKNCYIGPSASLRGDMGRIVMHSGSNVQDGCIIHAGSKHDTIIGEDAIVSHGAVLHGCEIKRNALIGINSVIMDGAVVGAQAFVAAASFVVAGFKVPPRTLVMGIPARVRRRIKPSEIAFIERGAPVYQALAGRSRHASAACKPLRKVTAKRMAQRNPSHSDETKETFRKPKSRRTTWP